MSLPTTISQLAELVSFSDVGLAILSVCGILITFYVTWRGAQFVTNAVISRQEISDQIERDRERT